MTPARCDILRRSARLAAGLFFVAAGLNHFRSSDFYQRIVPPPLPPALTVVFSGLAEVVGGVGLVWKPTRRIATWGLVALLVAVFPANLYMATTSNPEPKMGLPPWALWVRLPLQLPLIAWVIYAGGETTRTSKPGLRSRP